jgi:glycosyltransferase involved in cell wall biosynthesis
MDSQHGADWLAPTRLIPGRRLRVGVLVDLPLHPTAGGHVKCWERLALAAARFPDALDLTVHFAGPAPEIRPLGENVRYALAPPVFSTDRLGFLSHVPDHTDLAPWHPRLARILPRYDVIHTTDAYFAYARTALKVARRHGIPLVNSIHTDIPEYARLLTAATIERLLGRGRTARLLVERLAIPDGIERRMIRRLARYQDACAVALIARTDQLAGAVARLGGRAGLLRRGIDPQFFHPAKRDRAWLSAAHGIPPERLVVLCAGRLNRGKNMLLMVGAVTALAAEGIDIQLLCAGEGDLREAVCQRLGPRATCPGSVDAEHLARLYACADLFAYPSKVAECANVMLEALSSGLPVLVAHESSMERVLIDGEAGLTLPAADAGAWAAAMAGLAENPERRRSMGRAARCYAECHLPSWNDVLAEDLLPRWHEAVAAWHARRR